MVKFQKIKKIWGVIVNEWKTRYRLVFSNEKTHEQSFVIKRITIQKMVVTAIIAAFFLIFLTTIIIALTPLRMYIPGYTTQKDYKLYKQTAAQVDSLEEIIQHNQQYIDHISKMFAGDVPTIDETDNGAEGTPETHTTIRDKKRMAETIEVEEEAEMILGRISEGNENSNSNLSGISKANISNLSIYPPAIGSVVRVFDATKKHYGIDILALKNSVVSCIADGVVIFSGYNATDGNVIIIQHPGNLISIYKRNTTIMKSTGARVHSGEAIATIGNTGNIEGKTHHLHFELWYNGFPIDPLHYLVIE